MLDKNKRGCLKFSTVLSQSYVGKFFLREKNRFTERLLLLMQQHVSSFITPEQHDSLLISWSPHSTDKTATVIVRTIVKLHCCPIVKRLCKFQFRERGFAGNCTNLYLILPYDDFSGSSSAVRAESAVFDSKRDGAFTDKCTETKIFVLFFLFYFWPL